MLNHIFARELEARELLETRTAGWTDLRAALRPLTPEVAAGRCGIAPGTIRDLAERFVRARTSACYGRVGTNRGRYSTLTNILIESLNVVAGRFGQPGGWVTGISPIANPDVPTPFPPYGAQRSRIGNFPLILNYTPGGTLADEITTPGQGRMKALFVDFGNPVHSYPEGAKTEIGRAHVSTPVPN